MSGIYDLVLTSLYESFGTEILKKILEHSRAETLFVSQKKVKNLLELLSENVFYLKRVILFTDDPLQIEAIRMTITEKNLEFFTFEQVCDVGLQNRIDFTKLPKIDPSTPHFICYSSGTTGSHKGVIISHRSQASNTHAATVSMGFRKPYRHLSYLPLSHVFERIGVSVSTYIGGCIGFFNGNIKYIASDMQALKPTFLIAVPRVIQRMYEQVQENLKKASLMQKGVFWSMWYWKRLWTRIGFDSPLANIIVFNKIKAIMGSEVQSFIVGGAAMDKKIEDFMEVATGWPLRVGYGLTEAGSGCIINPNDIKYTKPGTIGGPLIHTEIKLLPIPDYEDESAGEILVGGELVSSGYLYDDDATEKLFTDESHYWIHTGDVAKWDEDGYLCVVDRLRSIFKLSQGEYVVVELLSQSYEKAPIVQQLFVYGDSTRDCLVAIVVPKIDAVAAFLKKDSLSDDEFRLACQSTAVVNEVQKQFDDIANAEKIVGFQRIRAIHLDHQPWTIENNLLTPTFKLRRNLVAQHYKVVIDNLYEKLSKK